MKVTRVSINVVEVPQESPVAPYRSRLRTSRTTRSAIVRVETDDGITGWGEHNVNFLDGISARKMEEQSIQWLLGRDPRNINRYLVRGRIAVPKKPGLGVEGDAEKIECYKVDG